MAMKRKRNRFVIYPGDIVPLGRIVESTTITTRPAKPIEHKDEPTDERTENERSRPDEEVGR